MSVASVPAMDPREALTTRLARDWAGLTPARIDADAAEAARHCALDWLGCAVAGSREPLAAILRDTVVGPSGPGPCTVVGGGTADARTAALANGAAGHALDFDDTHLLLSGHPTAPVLPAALAVAEELDASGAALLTALVVGIEVECRVGAVVNPEHYHAGWHATGTIGTIGAAAAAAHLLGLDTERFATALALAATQASGLKASFGTMAKPLHAGLAASAGVLSARLASGGFTAEPAVLEATQGFGRAAGGAVLDEARLARLDRHEGRFVVPDTLFKHHAACYLTHASINAARQLAAKVPAHEIDTVEVHVAPESLDVCAIAEPATGLEAKFSLRATTAMALLGDDTTDAAAYTDARAGHPELVALRDRVTVVPVPGRTGTCSRVVVVTATGDRLEAEDDTGRPAPDLDAQWTSLAAKCRGLVRPVLGDDRAEELVAAVAGLAELASARELAAVLR